VLEVENSKLKMLLAEAMPDNLMQKDFNSKNGEAHRSAGSRGSRGEQAACVANFSGFAE
jgi:hypothetical protein